MSRNETVRFRPGISLIGFIAAVTIAIAISACGPSPDVTPASLASTRTLEVWTAESGTRLTLVKKRAEAFAGANPNITVNITVRDFGSYPAQLKLALASDTAPDVVIGNLGWSLDGPLIKARQLRDLSPWAARYGWDKRYSTAVQRQMRFSSDGKHFGAGPIFGIPYAADVIGWFYNAGKLKNLGLKPPATFAELEADFGIAKAAGETPMMLGNKPQWPGLHVFYLISNNLASEREINGIVFAESGASWTAASLINSARKLAQWNSLGYFSAGANGTAPADAVARFSRGEGVFLPAGSWNAAEIAATMGENVGFFLTPPNVSGEARRATGSIGFGWHISAASKQADLAAAFIDHMTNDQWARQLAAGGDIAPLAASDPAPAMPSKLAGEIFAAWQSVLSNATLMPYLDSSAPNGAEVIFPTMQSILAGEQDPTQGLTDIEKARQQFLSTLR